ncbi:sensor histidine kinase [Abiotrophia defectiva]|uniref:histidine kinase n=1 Tax=Abiotrophia defectiva ATCC 49176 TaxID=592010 RepID=W1Q1F2_ABIDE|nr:HAMP domain-containing sensor histidine kinase [Abiotrophia defectiva]ESK64818.1 sensor histidine kinase family protein [Abiotrophia defectiva ATCC 49176]QKH46827.1 HAMP domain-containing histidine kinase [Abiotrophia defectiva]
MKDKDKKATQPLSMRLTRSERSELIVEAIITMSLIFFLYLSALLIYRQAIDYKLNFFGLDTTLRHMLGLTRQQIIVSVYIFSLASCVVAILVTNWRVKRRINQMKLAHILDYLKYIAQGHYEIRIPQTDLGEMDEVVSSINHLVDSTVRAIEEERKIEKSKDELITNIGHDIRTPLTSVIGYLGLIENQQYHSQEELARYAHVAYRKAQQMQSLVQDLFTYTATRQTTTEISPVQVQVLRFMEQLVADFELSAREKTIELRLDIRPKNLVASFDVDKMARVFHNLLSNALKYGIGAHYIELLAYQEEDYIYFKVKNDGQPLDQSELEDIFQRSYRADQSRSANQPGTGLGLAIVRNIVELHHGRVYAEVEGKETIFTIEIPQKSPQQ